MCTLETNSGENQMSKSRRKVLVQADIEKRILKNERRIQRIAEESYQLRQVLEKIVALPKQEPFVKPMEEK